MKELLRAIKSTSESRVLWLQYRDKNGDSEWRIIDLIDLFSMDVGDKEEGWEVKNGFLTSNRGVKVDPRMLYNLSQLSDPPKIRIIMDQNPHVMIDLTDPPLRKLDDKQLILIRKVLLNSAKSLLQKEVWHLYITELNVTVMGVSKTSEPNGWLIIGGLVPGEWSEPF